MTAAHDEIRRLRRVQADLHAQIRDLLAENRSLERMVEQCRARAAQLEGDDPLDVFRPGGA